MFVDFGVDPRAMDEMSMSQLSGLLTSIKSRRGDAPMPSVAKQMQAMEQFELIVSGDPSVRLTTEKISANS